MQTTATNSQLITSLASEQTLAQIRRADARYMGPCIVQAPDAWTRVGPTWLVPGVGWFVVGPGAATWGVTKGLAELAVEASGRPTWHPAAWAVCPTPALVFAVSAVALTSQSMAKVRELTAAAGDGRI